MDHWEARVGEQGRETHPGRPTPRTEFSATELRTADGPSSERNRGHDPTDPHRKTPRPPLCPRGFRKASGRAWVRCWKGPGEPPPTGTSTTIPWPPLLPQLLPASHSKVQRNHPADSAPCSRTSKAKAPSPVHLRLPPPHSKFASALTHWLAGRQSREETAQPPTQAEPRPSGRPGVTHSRLATTSGHPLSQSREGGVCCQSALTCLHFRLRVVGC